MTERILDFSLQPGRLRYGNGLLVLERHGEPDASFPVGEIACVVLGHPQITVTQAALGQLAKAGIAVVCCDEKFRPSGMLLPLDAHHRQSQRFEVQTKLSAPRKKRLWQSMVIAKIQAQGRVLEEIFGLDYGLAQYARRVGSGDPSNVEAQAARRYWTLLFAESDEKFRRANEDDPRNHLLDYGYGVLRSAVARALCASGLHPSLGIHHRNVYNPFPLADDVMEAFRPAVDRMVIAEIRDWEADAESALALTPERKQRLISAITARYWVEGETRTLLDVIGIACQRLAAFICGEQEKWEFPEWRTGVKKRAVRAISHHVDVCDVRSAG